MKKLFVFLFISTLLLVSSAYAEIGANAYSSDIQIGELDVYIYAYNNSGSDITSNAVVILDTTAANVASGTTLGAYITGTTTEGSSLALGITDEVIEDNSIGKICVRGPHKVWFTTTQGLAAAGNTVATSTTSGRVANTPANATSSIIGVLLSGTQTQDNSISGRTAAGGEPASLYWAWIGER